MKKRIIIILIILVIIFLCFTIFYNKLPKTGNTVTNKTTTEELQNYILNMNTYKATATITVTSNKNENKYIVKQEMKSPNIITQEVLEPSNIKGLKTIYDGNNLRIENTNLNLTTLYENYQYVADNILFLNSFIKEYQENPNSNRKENSNEIILMTSKENNKYLVDKTLYIDKNTKKPTKMEIKNKTQSNGVYILYNEIEINNI